MSIQIHAGYNTITFKLPSGDSVLDFSKSPITFTGDMDESAKQFIELLDKYYVKAVETRARELVKEK